MSNLLEHIQNGMKTAMKSGDTETTQLFRMMIAACKNKKIELGHELTDEEVIQVLRKQAKQRKDSMEQYAAGKRDDLVAKEAAELALIETLLPAQMSEEDVEKIVKDAIDESGFATMADRGKLMGVVMGKLKGQADGAIVNQVVSKLLS